MSTTPQWVTPRPWPAETEPSTPQLAAWLLVCTVEERERLVDRWRAAVGAEERCWIENHDGRLRPLGVHAHCPSCRLIVPVLPDLSCSQCGTRQLRPLPDEESA